MSDKAKDDELSAADWDYMNNVFGGSSSSEGFNFSNANVWDGVPFSIRRQYENPFIRKVIEAYIRFRMLFVKKKDVVSVFLDVKNNLVDFDPKELQEKNELIKEKITEFENSLQRFAFDECKNEGRIAQCELLLAQNGFTKYQTEESMISFIKKSEKGLCLTEIDRFRRHIPKSVVENIEKAISVGVLSNIYILHYDPTSVKNIYYTKEKEKIKDPVAFGVIYGSTNMYFIDDWVDEYCGLTYNEIIKTNQSDFRLKTK
jgi:hypothetical protein